jgi:hypothetical protein
MQWIYNKEGPDFDVGFPMTGRPRDGTVGRPRDGTERKPRDKTILWKSSLMIRYYYRITGPPQDFRIHGRPSSNWRTQLRSKPALETGKGEVCTLSTKYELRSTNRK